MSLEMQAALWLRSEKQCNIVLTERTPRPWCGQPDVLGITDYRYVLEIEVKRSVSDFRANASKPHMLNRCDGIRLDLFPKQFWFLVPLKLVEKVEAEVPAWAGLLTVTEEKDGWHSTVTAVKRAPVNNESKKLSLKECVKLVRCIGNEIFALRLANRSLISRRYLDCHHMDDFHSKIPTWDDKSFKTVWVENPDYLNFQI